MKKKQITWQQVEDICNQFADNIKATGYQYYAVGGVGRGGLVPATIIANALNIPRVYNFGCHSRAEDKTQKKMTIYQAFPFISHDTPIIVVDDIYDTGYTIEYLRKAYDYYDFTYYTMFLRKGTQSPENHQYSIVTEGDEWLVMPWEKQ